MAIKYDSEGFVSTPLEGQGARSKDSYFQASEEDEAQFKEADTEYRRLKADFARIARTRWQRNRSKSESSRRPSPVRWQPLRRSTNLPKIKIATFYSTDVELWFNQIETQFDLHQITDDDERYNLTCATLSREVASDVRDVLLQPFLTHKYESLKGILVERRGLTTPGRVNKVISGEKIGSDIPSRFPRRLQKTASFGTKAVVGKAVIRQAFIRQMPTSIRAHLATQPDSALLESLAMLADRALASKNDVDESKPGGCWNPSKRDQQASRTIRRPVWKVKKVRDSDSRREEEEFRTCSDNRQLRPYGSVCTQRTSKTICTKQTRFWHKY